MFRKTCRIFAIIFVLSIVFSSCDYGNQDDPSADTATQANENTVSAVEEQTTAKAASYVSIVLDGKTYWGAGIDSDIIVSSVKALISAVNIMLCEHPQG